MPQSYGFIFKPARDFREKLLKKFYGCMQAHEEEYSSGSIKQFKWFSQRVQTSQLADADVSISLQIRLR